MPIRSRVAAPAALFVLILIWGTTWAGIRLGLEGIPPLKGVALRFAIAALVLGIVARHLGVRLWEPARLWRVWVANTALTFCASYGVVYWAEQWISSGLASILFSTFPLFVAILAHFLLPGERLSRWSVLGTAIGFLGVLLIFSEDLGQLGGPEVRLASLIFLISPASAALGNILVKRWGNGVHPLALVAVPMGFTGLIMGSLAVALERHREISFDALSVGALLYLAVLGSALTFTLYFWLLSRLPATRLALLTYGVPIVAVTLGTIFMGEVFTLRMLAGSFLVIAGVGAAMRRGRRAGV